MSRLLRDIPDGATVMADANVLVYALTPQAQLHVPCRDLLERGARGTLELFTSVSVAADTLHRAMVLEVLAQGRVQRAAEAVALIKQHPDLVTQLRRYRTILRKRQPPKGGQLCPGAAPLVHPGSMACLRAPGGR